MTVGLRSFRVLRFRALTWRSRSALLLLLMLCICSEVAAESKLEWFEKKRSVMVFTGGEAVVTYNYELYARSGFPGLLRFSVPVGDRQTELESCWGTISCGNVLTDGIHHAGALTFDVQPVGGFIQYGFRVRVQIGELAAVFADEISLNQPGPAAKVVNRLRFDRPRRLFWRLSDGWLLDVASEVGNEPGVDFYWVMRPGDDAGSRMADDRLMISTVDSWALVGKTLACLWSVGSVGFSPPDPQNLGFVTADGGELTADLLRYLQGHFEYRQNRRGEHIRLPDPSVEVWRRKWGDCKDMVLLMTCMLRSWGVSANPVLAATGRSSSDVGLPNPLIFDHALLAVADCGRTRYFDPVKGAELAGEPPYFFMVLPWVPPVTSKAFGSN